ncbi:LOW QUALITY PROTEIN: DNA polymerase epsilon subunit 3-like [Gigantopelta aegis]|uniref:LOW QUALITY PROTEIN: DNA polymerase epsilon subunit 3-like n=1 Tax=Gigantopelta aegis TaxID=1735272 RepID=UPI001B888D2C|nr:LOW QUALITY PROTEIN: DNA polymerase epsilon subunit 3-like [Gigantopelta aegis]
MAEKPEDLNLPASVVARIIKEALPEGVNVSKEAKSAIGRAASIFILYATTCANTYAIKGKRKTITPNDLFQAIEDMELQEFLPEMKECLDAFKKEQKEKKEAAADRKRKQTARPVNTAKVLDSIPKEKPVPSWKKALQERKAVAAAKKKIEESKQEQVNAEKSHDIVSPVRKGLEDRHSLAQVMQIFEHTSKDPDKEKHIQDEKDIPQLAQQQQQTTYL